ncbi:MAG: hypothetical protein ACSW8J_04115 [bacterium]
MVESLRVLQLTMENGQWKMDVEILRISSLAIIKITARQPKGSLIEGAATAGD